MKLLLLLATVALAQEHLFLDAPTPLDTRDLVPETAPDARFVVRERYAKMDLSKFWSEDTLMFNLFDDAVYQVDTTSMEKSQKDFFMFQGETQEGDWSTVNLVFNEDIILGHVQVDEKVFMIRPVEHGVKVIEIDQSRFPNEADPVEAEEEAEPVEGDGYVWPAVQKGDRNIKLLQNNVVDILHLEPASSQAACGNINLGAIESQYQNHMNSVWGSQYGVLSRVMARCYIRNVTNNFSGELSNLRSSAGVAQARNDLGADLVALIINVSGNICGIAYKPNLPVSQSDQNTAFSVDARSCAIPNWTYAHEFGHNFGLNHDRYVTGGGASQCNFGGFNNYNAPTTRSIMSYNNRCTQVYGRNCQRLGTYSNGGSLGRTCGGTSTGEDCRRDFLRAYPVVSNYR